MPYLCLLITAQNNRFKLIVHESPMATWVATNIAKSNLSTYKSYPDAPSLVPSQPSMNWSKHFLRWRWCNRQSFLHGSPGSMSPL